jgi:hypothetical protein
VFTTAAILALIGIPTIAALTTGSALTMAVAWSQVAGLGIQAVRIAEQLPQPQLSRLSLPRPKAQRGRGHIVAVVQGGPAGWGRAPVHFVYESR